jgi:hypothetical protein
MIKLLELLELSKSILEPYKETNIKMDSFDSFDSFKGNFDSNLNKNEVQNEK